MSINEGIASLYQFDNTVICSIIHAGMKDKQCWTLSWCPQMSQHLTVPDHQQTWRWLQSNNIFTMTSSNGNIFRVTGPLCGEFTGPGEFPAQRPVTRSFDVFFDLRLNKRLSKQREAGDLRRNSSHYDVIIMYTVISITCWPDGVIQNGRRDPMKSRGTWCGNLRKSLAISVLLENHLNLPHLQMCSITCAISRINRQPAWHITCLEESENSAQYIPGIMHTVCVLLCFVVFL